MLREGLTINPDINDYGDSVAVRPLSFCSNLTKGSSKILTIESTWWGEGMIITDYLKLIKRV